MKTSSAIWAVAMMTTLAAACSSGDAKAAKSTVDATANAPVPTIESELATFRSGMKANPVLLTGPPSRDSLVRLFERALAKNDTAGLDRLQITREEFAYLYYPESKMARPPYELSPDLMWMQIESRRERGLSRLVAAYGGQRLRVQDLKCQPPERENAVVLHQCGILQPGKGAKEYRLFGSIIERDGRFKFVGYSNPL